MTAAAPEDVLNTGVGRRNCPTCRLAVVIAGQVLYSLLVLLLVATVAFVGLRLAPGDVTTQLLDPVRTPPEQFEALRRELGLDRRSGCSSGTISAACSAAISAPRC